MFLCRTTSSFGVRTRLQSFSSTEHETSNLTKVIYSFATCKDLHVVLRSAIILRDEPNRPSRVPTKFCSHSWTWLSRPPNFCVRCRDVSLSQRQGQKALHYFGSPRDDKDNYGELIDFQNSSGLQTNRSDLPGPFRYLSPSLSKYPILVCLNMTGAELSNLTASDLGIDLLSFHIVAKRKKIGESKKTFEKLALSNGDEILVLARCHEGMLQCPITDFVSTTLTPESVSQALFASWPGTLPPYSSSPKTFLFKQILRDERVSNCALQEIRSKEISIPFFEKVVYPQSAPHAGTTLLIRFGVSWSCWWSKATRFPESQGSKLTSSASTPPQERPW